ncbi:MAG: peptidylprolyl isomerase, partial [Planctomycetes bacterium]|nr:peptidylprolyl isomerase [Planctomycetota bacterium]
DGQDAGTLKIQLDADRAPITVRNFLRICARGFYDGLTFHRVISTFMAQAGCENGDGSGRGPLPPIPGEFSNTEPARHTYGTLSMARGPDPNSAGAQFFVILDEGFSSWSLNGQYASFGHVVEGGDTLEAIAGVPVEMNFQRELSRPTKRIEIVSARVLPGGLRDKGPLPMPVRESDREGWPNTVEVQTLLIAEKGGIYPTERTADEATQVATELLARAQAGEDFNALVVEYSDDPVQRDSQPPVGFRFAREGSNPKAGLMHMLELKQEFQGRFDALGVSKRQGMLSSEEVARQARELQVELMRAARTETFIPAGQQPSLAQVAFDLEVGEVRLIPRDRSASMPGPYLMKRIR